jgi:predicted deacylase
VGTPAFSIIRNGHGRPELWLVAGIHGDEMEGIACVTQALEKIRCERGTLVGVPVAHRAAVEAGTRLGPDGLDLNRSFPGDPAGPPTHRLARELLEAIAGSADALLTFHSWTRTGAATPYVEHLATDPEGQCLAHSLGVPFVEPWHWPEGLLPHQAALRGVPSAELELFGLGRHTAEGLRVGVRAAEHAAHWLGLTGPTKDLAAPPPLAVARETVVAGAEGLVYQLAELGSAVERGQALAEIRAEDGRTIECLRAGRKGWLGVHVTYGFVRPGDKVTVVFHTDADTPPAHEPQPNKEVT